MGGGLCLVRLCTWKLANDRLMRCFACGLGRRLLVSGGSFLTLRSKFRLQKIGVVTSLRSLSRTHAPYLSEQKMRTHADVTARQSHPRCRSARCTSFVIRDRSRFHSWVNQVSRAMRANGNSLCMDRYRTIGAVIYKTESSVRVLGLY